MHLLLIIKSTTPGEKMKINTTAQCSLILLPYTLRNDIIVFKQTNESKLECISCLSQYSGMMLELLFPCKKKKSKKSRFPAKKRHGMLIVVGRDKNARVKKAAKTLVAARKINTRDIRT